MRSLDRYCNNRFQNILRKGRVLKPRYNNKGYVSYALWDKNHIRKDCKGHSLILKTFIKKGFENECINHKNGKKDDNRLFNLEYCTLKYNSIHALENHLFKHKKRKYNFNKCSKEKLREVQINNLNKYRHIATKKAKDKNKKTIFQYTKEGEFIKKWDSARDVERYYGKRLHLEHKTSLGFVWKREELI